MRVQCTHTHHEKDRDKIQRVQRVEGVREEDSVISARVSLCIFRQKLFFRQD